MGAQPQVTTRLAVAPNVAQVSFNLPTDPQMGPVYLGLLPDGPLVVLHGSARLIWTAAPGEESSVVDRVADLAGVDAATVASDVGSFVDSLVTQGLLRRLGG